MLLQVAYGMPPEQWYLDIIAVALDVDQGRVSETSWRPAGRSSTIMSATCAVAEHEARVKAHQDQIASVQAALA